MLNIFFSFSEILQLRQHLDNSNAIFYWMNLITELLMFNGHRAGVVVNMTMKEWQDTNGQMIGTPLL